MCVLVVDDDVKMAGLIRRGLLEEAAAGIANEDEAAIWMANSAECDAIVIDVMLPAIDGFGVFRKLPADGV